MNHPHRPLTKRKMVQLMVILTLLAWATQTLFHQWGYGSPPTTELNDTGPPTLEIRESAAIAGPQIKLHDIARWTPADAKPLRKLSHIVIAQFTTPELRKQLTATDIRTALGRAGVAPTSLQLSGSSTCLLTRIISASTSPGDNPEHASRDAGFQPVHKTAQQEQELPPTTQPSFTVHPGDFITVTFDFTTTKTQTILRAEQQGTLGSTIRAKNEATHATHLVTLTSPTEATWTPRLD